MAYVYGPVTTSDEKSASATIYAAQSHFHGFEILPPASGYAILKIYDSADSTLTGKKIVAEAQIAAGMNSIFLALVSPRVCNQGVRAELTGTGSTTYTVGFSPT